MRTGARFIRYWAFSECGTSAIIPFPSIDGHASASYNSPRITRRRRIRVCRRAAERIEMPTRHTLRGKRMTALQRQPNGDRDRLSATIHFLGDILGEVIREQAGPAAFALEERVRGLAKDLRAS